MAIRGSNKDLSVRHENNIAQRYDGIRSKSSGASAHDDGDVRTQRELIECKASAKGLPARFKKELEKIALEAWGEGRDPVLCVRYNDPKSILADPQGWVDLTIRLTKDDELRTYGS